MNHSIQAALMAKATKVFSSADTFLSFPVSPLPFQPRELDLLSDGNADEARQSQRNLQAFSTLVNLLPDDEAWLPNETRFLWDVYAEVLRDANFATSSRTPDEEAAYKKAVLFLRETDAEGRSVDTAAVRAYRQHKDSWYVAQQRYQVVKGTAETSTDAALLLAWSTEEEPKLRAELNALQAKWVLEGFKSEVESAQSTVASLGAKSPIQTWAEWKGHFNRDLDSLTGATIASTVYPTFFSPVNALENAAWRPFQLSSSEIAVLLRDAPAELRERLEGAAGAVSDVTSLTFEFSSAILVRPWFAPELFRSRFWRFSDGGRRISSGEASPPSGDCSAYVTAIVFARKIVEQRPQVAATSVEPFSGFRFSMAVRNPEIRNRIELEQTAALHTRTALSSALLTAKVRPAAHTFAAAATNDRISMVAAPALAAPRSNLMMRASPHAFRRMVAPVVPAPPAAAPPPPAIASPPDDSIYVLAFICKRVPLCPNPDPALQW